MKKNRGYLLALLLLIVLFFSKFGAFFVNSDLRTYKCMEAIVSAINEQDGRELKSLFSPNAIDESEDIDGQITALLDFVSEQITSWSTIGGTPSDEDFDHGKKRVMTWPVFMAQTDTSEYIFGVIFYPVDSFDKQNEGIYSIVVTEAPYSGQFPAWQDRVAGIAVYN